MRKDWKRGKVLISLDVESRGITSGGEAHQKGEYENRQGKSSVTNGNKQPNGAVLAVEEERGEGNKKGTHFWETIPFAKGPPTISEGARTCLGQRENGEKRGFKKKRGLRERG